MSEETNLFKFLLKGLKVNIQLNVEKAKRSNVTTVITQLLAGYLRNRYLRFLLATLKSAAIIIKLSQEDAFDLFMDFLNHVNGKVPDGAYLVDYFGAWLERVRWTDNLEQLPPEIRALVDTFTKIAICDAKAGFTSEKASIIYGFKSEGFLELYQLAMAGFK